MSASRRILSMAIALAFGCGATLAAQDMPSVDYQKAEISLMRALDGAAIHLNQKDFRTLADDAASLRAGFADLERFWIERNAADAMVFAKAGATAALDLQRASELNDSDRVKKAFEAAASTCRTCHLAYALPGGEGGFAIRSTAQSQPVEPLAKLAADVHRPGRDGIRLPRLIQQVKPSYTAEAMRVGIQGSVLLTCTVLPDGTPTDINVLRSLDPVFGLDREAIKATEQWRFAPGTRMGEPVKVRVTLELSFASR